MEIIRRGEVWVGNLNPNRGAEIGKIRPVLVIQADAMLAAGATTIVVLPLTTQIRPQMQHYRIHVPARDRLLQDCQIVIDKPRTLDRKRFGEGPLARLTRKEMESVEISLKAVLDLG